MVLPLLSALVSTVFAALMLDQYLRHRRPHQLVWTFGLVWYAVATYTQYLGVAYGWEETPYRLWYLTGAIYVAAWLGMGTVYLLAPRRVAHVTMLLVLLGSAVGAGLVFSAPIALDHLPAPGEAPSGEAFPSYVRFPLTPVMNIFGATALFGGALWSAWRLWRQKQHPDRAAANVLIALGALSNTLGGTLARFGLPAGLALSQFVGILLILAGFLLALGPARFVETSSLFRLLRFPLRGRSGGSG